MDARQRIGGIAALVAAGTFVFGFAMALTVLADYTTGDPTAAESAAFVADHEGALWLWHVVILIVFGAVLVPLVLAIHERLRAGDRLLGRSATAFGLIWAGLVIAAGMVGNIGLGSVADLYGDDPAQAAALWSAVDAVQNGLGGGNEVVGGLWVLLVSAAALQTAALPRAASSLGVVAGAAGLVTVVPGLEDVGAVFGRAHRLVWVGGQHHGP